MTKMRVTTIIGVSGSAWFDSDETVREFLQANGLVEVPSLGLPGVTTRPGPGEEFFIYYRENQTGMVGGKFSLVRADGYRGTTVDSGIITDQFPPCRNQRLVEVRGTRLIRWMFFCEPVPVSGDAQDFRFFLGSEVGN